MERKFFGTDGIRSVAGEFPLTVDFALALGRAAAEVLKATNKNPMVVIGRDTRRSGDMLEWALAAGFNAQGVDVIHLGIIPTPGVSYLTRALGAAAGVVISASHNPFADNGIKFFSDAGEKLADDLEIEIEKMLERALVGNLSGLSGVNVGTVEDYHEAERLYGDFLQKLAPDLSGLKIAIDCANGATYRLAPKIFQRAGADVFAVFVTPDGQNINLGCGSTKPKALQKMIPGQFDFGITFDGDGDRTILIDSEGELIHGDHMLYINALMRQESAVVGTLMTNLGLENKLFETGIKLERTKVGDRYVFERLQENQLKLGGEPSGHMLFLDIAPTGDGIVTALQTLKAMKQSGLSLAQWRKKLPMFPQLIRNVAVPHLDVSERQILADKLSVKTALQSALNQLDGRGRVNLRPSGTEALWRVMVEGPDESEVSFLADQLTEALQKAAYET